MALAKYLPACGKNQAGNDPLGFQIEGALITSVTETTGEVSAITMLATNKFVRVLAEAKTVQVTSDGMYGSAGGRENKIAYGLSKVTAATTAYLDELQAAMACGIVHIVVDQNRNGWIVGISEAAKEGKSNLIKKMETSFDSGTEFNAEEGQMETVTLTQESWYRPRPLTTALTATIIGGTATFIDWT